jgi:hypothetical protein
MADIFGLDDSEKATVSVLVARQDGRRRGEKERLETEEVSNLSLNMRALRAE